MVPQQHAVERLGGGDQLGAVLGEDDALDQRIDRRILDAGIVARAGAVGGLRAPDIALLVAGRQRLRPSTAMMMSKSQLRIAIDRIAPRRRCARVTSMPSRSSEGL